MPELPAVEFTRNLVHTHCLAQTIQEIRMVKDEIVFGAFPNGEMIGKKIIDTGRYGKWLWIVLENGYIMMHLGMTGFLQIKGIERMHYKSAPAESSLDVWPPKYWKFCIVFEERDSPELAFGDPRRLGRVFFQKEKPVDIVAGFDPILCMPEEGAFRVRTIASRTRIKALLLDQSFAAGVGNWMADEILYRARIHPIKRASELSEQECTSLYRAIVYVSKTAVEACGNCLDLPESWLFHYRWEQKKPKNKRSKVCMQDGNTVEYIKVSGRTTAYVPKLQRL